MTMPTTSRTIALTALAMMAFAANSLFNKAGFTGDAIDAGSFAAIRLMSAAVALTIISLLTGQARQARTGGRFRDARHSRR